MRGKETILALAGGIKNTDQDSIVSEQFLRDLAEGTWTRFIIGNSKWQGDPNALGGTWTVLSYGSDSLQDCHDKEVPAVLEQLDSFTNSDKELTKELSYLMTFLPLKVAFDHLIAHRNQLQSSAPVFIQEDVVYQCRLMKHDKKTVLHLRFEAVPKLENESDGVGTLYVEVMVDITAWRAIISSGLVI